MIDLPSGWVPLSHFDSRDRGKSDGHSAEYKLLVAAVRDGELRGLQDPKSRRYYVPQDEANRLLIGKASQAAEKPSAKACELAAADSLASIDTTLDEIYRVLERLTTAVENIATQPKAEPVGSWRDMNGEAH